MDLEALSWVPARVVFDSNLVGSADSAALDSLATGLFFCGLLVFAAPLFCRERAAVPKADNDLLTDRSVLIVDNPLRKAA